MAFARWNWLSSRLFASRNRRRRPRPICQAEFLADRSLLTPTIIVDAAPELHEPNNGGATATYYYFTLSEMQTSDTIVNYSRSGTATCGVDYQAASSGSVTIPANTLQVLALLLTANSDIQVEGDETAVLTVMPGTGYIDGASFTTIIHDAPPLTVSVTANPANAAEYSETTGGPVNGNFTISRVNGDPTQPLDVTITVGGSAADGIDFNATPALTTTVTIPVGFSAVAFTIAPIEDTDYAEGTETVILTIAAPTTTPYLGVGGSATVNILDAPQPQLSIADSVGFEGPAPDGIVEFIVSLNRSSPNTITVNYATSIQSGDTASLPDIAAGSGPLTFAPNEITKIISVTIIDDMSAEETEAFSVTLSNATAAAIIDGLGKGTINDNDEATITLTLADDIVVVNDNDDNLNNVLDFDESSTSSDPDLVLATVTVTSTELVGWTVEIDVDAGAELKLWTTAAKTNQINLPATYTLGSGSPSLYFPATLFLEGIEPGDTFVQVSLKKPSGNQASNDSKSTAVPQLKIRKLTGSGMAGTYLTEVDETDVRIGERVRLAGWVFGAAGLAKTDRQWTVPGNRVKDYEIIVTDANSPTSGTVIPLTVFNEEQISYCWVDGGTKVKVSHQVKVDGKLITRGTTFDILKPHDGASTAAPVTAWTVTNPNGIKLWGQDGKESGLAFGNPQSENIVDAGIQFHYDAGDEFYGGTVKWLQVGQRSDLYIYDDGTDETVNTAGLDGAFPYPAVQGNVAVDIPGFDFNIGHRCHQGRGDYKMYLMYNYKPSSPEDAIWVPILVVDWFWQGTALSADGVDWEIVAGSTDHSIMPLFVPTTVFPEWDRFLTPSTP